MEQSKKQKGLTAASKEDGSEPISEDDNVPVSEVSDGRLPSAVTKRIERLRTRLRERVGDLRKAEVEISEISSIMEDSQADWLARHGDKLEKLIANADPDDAPKFARATSLLPDDVNQEGDPDTLGIDEEGVALFTRIINTPNGILNRLLERLSRGYFTGGFFSSSKTYCRFRPRHRRGLQTS